MEITREEYLDLKNVIFHSEKKRFCPNCKKGASISTYENHENGEHYYFFDCFRCDWYLSKSLFYGEKQEDGTYMKGIKKLNKEVSC